MTLTPVIPRTSKIAYDSMQPTLSTRKSRILGFLRTRSKTYGATCEEIEIALSMKHQTASAAMTDMKDDESIVPVLTEDNRAHTRRTSTGRPAVVWTARE